MSQEGIHAVRAEIKEQEEGNIEFNFPGLKTSRVPTLAVMMLFRRQPMLKSPLEALQNLEGKFEGKDRTPLT
jgi:hypothetical protein